MAEDLNSMTECGLESISMAVEKMYFSDMLASAELILILVEWSLLYLDPQGRIQTVINLHGTLQIKHFI